MPLHSVFGNRASGGARTFYMGWGAEGFGKGGQMRTAEWTDPFKRKDEKYLFIIVIYVETAVASSSGAIPNA